MERLLVTSTRSLGDLARDIQHIVRQSVGLSDANFQLLTKQLVANFEKNVPLSDPAGWSSLIQDLRYTVRQQEQLRYKLQVYQTLATSVGEPIEGTRPLQTTPPLRNQRAKKAVERAMQSLARLDKKEAEINQYEKTLVEERIRAQQAYGRNLEAEHRSFLKNHADEMAKCFI
ncbi:hypothetical protein IWQ61_009573 [Dispira simplex]|nr:hypothetical protein IWQ61_009573 [Dispira simplex]